MHANNVSLKRLLEQGCEFRHRRSEVAWDSVQRQTDQFRPDMPAFLRGGWSEGWQLDRSLNGGWGWRPFQQYSDLFGLAAGWAEPANHNLRTSMFSKGFIVFS